MSNIFSLQKSSLCASSRHNAEILGNWDDNPLSNLLLKLGKNGHVLTKAMSISHFSGEIFRSSNSPSDLLSSRQTYQNCRPSTSLRDP